MRTIARASLAAMIVLAGCGGDNGAATGPSPGAVASIAFPSASSSLGLHTTFRLLVTVLDAEGRDASAATTLTWSSSNPAIAAVDATGLITGAALGGPVTISATAGGHAATTAVTVTPARIDITPTVIDMVVGTTLQLHATPVDGAGVPIDAGPLAWSVSPAGVATVDQTGLVTAVAPGNLLITVSAAGKNSSLGILAGTPSVYDGYFSNTTGTVLVTLTVRFGLVTAFTANIRPFPLCFVSVNSTPNAPIDSAGRFTGASGVAGVSFSGTFGSPNSVQGQVFVLGVLDYNCSASGTSSPNTVGGGFLATRY